MKTRNKNMMMLSQKSYVYLKLLISLLLLTNLNAYANTGKGQLSQLCPLITGQWQGSAANPSGNVKSVETAIMCSADQRNLYISVSKGARFNNSETWWFRLRGQALELIYSDGINADINQSLTLYQQGDGFTFLGKGQIQQRPALVRLSFDPIDSADNKRWLWQQSAHYLDDDSDSYQVIRAIELNPLN
ncbi:hypothetical protein [Shewanella gaetbuli]|uniref:Uncharacterized protein n=1 Tax=Shewanella gaetbuli TaxID=220752 RepID=A0A9X2CGX3_9GAMM|nr:hypothetical protein [Shewanella gaetbuli]MCL1142863.1 hypothetical protein [Shewanella gaetbuli]